MKRFLAFVSFMALLLVAGCHPEPFLTVNPASLSFSQDGGSQTVNVSANYPWTASVSGTGITVSPTSGDGDATVTVTASAASSTSEMSGSVTFRSEGLSAVVDVKQDAKSAVIVGDVAKIPAEGGTFKVDIQYNTEYTVEIEKSAQTWITFNGTKAMQSGKLEFAFAANEGEQRTGKVTVTDKSGKVQPITLTFVQAEEEKVIEIGEVTKVSYKAGYVEVDIKYNTDFSVEVEESAQSWLLYLDIETKAMKNGILEFAIYENYGAERSANVTVRDNSGKLDPIVLTIVQEVSPQEGIRRALTEFYNAMDGPNWVSHEGWATDLPLRYWQYVTYDEDEEGVTSIRFPYNTGLKGEIPSSIGELTSLKRLIIWEEPGITGTLPDSFSNLVNLEWLYICGTSMTSLPDVFGGMTKLETVAINDNFEMTGPIPESLGVSDNINQLNVGFCKFTGTVPSSWAKHRMHMNLWANHLSGKIPQSFLEGTHDEIAYGLKSILNQQEGYYFDIDDIEIPGYWPLGELEDFISGQSFTFADVVKKNKYTIYLSWAPWCPFSQGLMPVLVDYYNKYHDSGLEIIATQMVPEDLGNMHYGHEEEEQKLPGIVREKGYDKWYNFFFSTTNSMSYPSGTPSAEVYDSNGNVVFSTFNHFHDGRKRYGDYYAASDLIPFLEKIIGPAEDPEEYESTDFSMDGVVMTLQKACVGDGINIVFMGDAYTDRDMESDGLYETVMRQSMDEFFAIEPYKTFKNRFNVYAVKVVSKNGKTGAGYSTAIGSVAASNSISTGDLDKCYEYALKVPEIKDRKNLLVGVLVNSLYERGITNMNEENQSAVAFYASSGNTSDAFGITLRHEAGGHGFAFLDDEYENIQGEAPEEHINDRNTKYQKYGWYSNVDFTDDPAKVKWSAFLSDDRYKDEVGIFEGGSLYSKGAYRPSKNSMMRDNMPYFNAPSRWAIYQRIMKLSGEECSFEKFLEYDAVNR